MPKTVPCTDHLGHEFKSIAAMCRAWYVSDTAYRRRVRDGWTVEEALTGAGPDKMGKPCTDHQGQKFPSIEAMCRHWGTTYQTYLNRIRNGLTVEQALTLPKRPGSHHLAAIKQNPKENEHVQS